MHERLNALSIFLIIFRVKDGVSHTSPVTKIKPLKLGHWLQGNWEVVERAKKKKTFTSTTGRLGYLKTSRKEITMCFHFTTGAVSLRKKEQTHKSTFIAYQSDVKNY